jgi:flagellar basal body P-ring formation protein FlgA
MLRLALCLALAPAAATADTLIAARTIRALSVITAEDISFDDAPVKGALAEPSQVVGMEARAVLYAGRPIRPGDIGPPAIVARNQTVPIGWRKGGLNIVAEGRSLDRGAAGDTVRAMNLASRTIVTGMVTASGTILVDGIADRLKGNN